MRPFKEVSIADICGELPATVEGVLSDDLLIADMRYVKKMRPLFRPLLFEGFFALFCYDGEVSLEVNLRKISVKAGELFLYVPGNTIRLMPESGEEGEESHILAVAVSKKTISATVFDMGKVFDSGFALVERPCVRLADRERRICRGYLELLKEISASGISGVENSVSHILSSLFMLMGSLWKARLALERESSPENATPGGRRKRAIMEKFLRLAKENHVEHKAISFYAQELCLTPRYLSKIILDQSGKSAHGWIDLLLVLDAKNLLKFTDLSVKDVAYELNFESQTSFYKFFKKQTGMTPMAYKRS